MAYIASLAYVAAAFGFIVSGYPNSMNDFVNLNALWGLVMTVAIVGQYLAPRKLVSLVKLLLLMLLALIIVRYVPWESVSCLLHCKHIAIRILKGEAITLFPGPHLLVFVLSLGTLFGIALVLSANRAAE